MTEQNCAEHFFFGDDIRTRFNHHDCVLGTGQAEVKSGFGALCAVGVDDVFAVHHTDHDGARRTRKRYIGDRKRDGRTDHSEHFGRNVGVNGQNRCDNGNVVVHSLGEQRTNGTVDKAGSKDCLVGRAAFSLFETAGDFADGVHFFFVVHAQGEVIHTFAGFFCHSCVDHNHGVAATDDTASVSLTAVSAGFDGDFSAADSCFEDFSFHFNSFWIFRHIRFYKNRVRKQRTRPILLSQSQRSDDSTITFDIGFLEIVEKTSSLTDHHKQTASGVVVFVVNFKVFGEFLNSAGEECDLHFGGTGVAFFATVLCDDFLFLKFIHCLASFVG